MFGSVLWLCNTTLQFLDTVGASGHHGETKQEQEKRCEMIIKDRSDAQWPKSSLCLPASAAVIGAPPHLSLLQPIRPGEELLVWYTVEDNPEITAALEEERANSLNRKNSHRAKQGEASLQTSLRASSGFSSDCPAASSRLQPRFFHRTPVENWSGELAGYNWRKASES